MQLNDCLGLKSRKQSPNVTNQLVRGPHLECAETKRPSLHTWPLQPCHPETETSFISTCRTRHEFLTCHRILILPPSYPPPLQHFGHVCQHMCVYFSQRSSVQPETETYLSMLSAQPRTWQLFTDSSDGTEQLRKVPKSQEM